MQTTQVVSSGQPVVLQGAPTIIHEHPRGLRNGVSVKETRVMGILQVIIGILSFLLGIPLTVLLRYYAASVAYPIWSGIWIIVTGALGISSAQNPTNGCINGTHMGFNIVSCFIAFVDFITYAVAVSYLDGHWTQDCSYKYSPYCERDSNWKVWIAIYAILMILMIAEFVIALTASIYCCKAGCDCCSNGTPGVIIQPMVAGQPVVSQVSYLQTSHAGPGQMPMVYPGTIQPAYYSNQGPYVQQPYYTTTPGQMNGPATTVVSYSNDGMDHKPSPGAYTAPTEPPPAYN